MSDATFWRSLDCRLAQFRMAIRAGEDYRPLAQSGVPEATEEQRTRPGATVGQEEAL